MKLPIVLGVSLVLCARVAGAQPGEAPVVAAAPPVAPIVAPEEPASLIDINPFSLAAGEISIEYEQALSRSLSLVVGPQVLAFPGVGSTSGSSEYGVGASASLHFFPGGHALHGWWLGPEADIRWAHVKLDDATATGTGVGIYGILGYTFSLSDHLRLPIGLGAGYASAGAEAHNSQGETATAGYTGFSLTGRLAIGYAW